MYIYASKDIVGFEGDSLRVGVKFTDKRGIDGQGLRTVHRYLQARLAQDTQVGALVPEPVRSTIAGNYDNFLEQVFQNGRRGGGLFAGMKPLWPSRQELEGLRKQESQTYEALRDFELDLLRDGRPIFDVILTNVSLDNIVVHSGLLEIKNLRVNTFPIQGGGAYTLKVTAHYDWQLTSLEDPKYKSWFESRRATAPDGFRAEYNEHLPPSHFEMNPPLVVEAKQPVRFRVRFTGGYHWPSDIRFSFQYGKQRCAVSQWFEFRP